MQLQDNDFEKRLSEGHTYLYRTRKSPLPSGYLLLLERDQADAGAISWTVVAEFDGVGAWFQFDLRGWQGRARSWLHAARPNGAFTKGIRGEGLPDLQFARQ